MQEWWQGQAEREKNHIEFGYLLTYSYLCS